MTRKNDIKQFRAIGHKLKPVVTVAGKGTPWIVSRKRRSMPEKGSVNKLRRRIGHGAVYARDIGGDAGLGAPVERTDAGIANVEGHGGSPALKRDR